MKAGAKIMDVGIEFGNYRVIEHIGRGGMADVWSARDRRLGRTVAVKTIARNLRSDTSPVELFEHEARTIAALEHPHILPVYEFGDFEGQLYIVMRYVTGGSLEDVVEQGALPVNEVLRITRAVSDALGHAHSNHIVHLDIKPSNILLDSNQAPYLADFGLATMLGPEGRTQNPGSGTLMYMAPEQLTSESIDHRADIYSFCVTLYHLLAGQLPFDATTPLAFKQLQAFDQLPDIARSDVPEGVTEILRQGTAMDPAHRPADMATLLRLLEGVLASTASSAGFAGQRRVDSDTELGDLITSTQLAGGADAQARREAQDLYQRARRAWAYGQGRFLLGVTHFTLINDYYMYADRYGLELDDAGMQMLLRGALEYDHEIDFWWDRLADDSRRWVALHALRSENAPARLRALNRLATVTDSDPSTVPLQIAQAIEVETSEQTMMAGIKALEKRGSGAPGWRDVAFSPEIDRVLADQALTSPFPAIAERAARAVGRVRSIAALQVIADQQRVGARGALQALALIRDEAPSLPSVVSPQARFYAWMTNTWRRLSDQPMGLVWRALSAGIGAFIAIGINTYFTFRSGDIFNSDRWKLTVSIGLFCAVVYGALVLLTDELPSRLRGFWPWWARLIVSALFGLGIGAALWALWTYLYLSFTLDTNLALLAGAGAGIGYVASTMLALPGWAGLIVTAVATYLPLYATFTSNTPVLYYDYPDQIFSLTIPLAVIMAIGGFAPKLLHSLRVWLSRRPRKTVPLPMPQRVSELGVRAPLVLDPDATEISGRAEPVGPTPSQVAPRITKPMTAGSSLAPRPSRLTRPNLSAETSASAASDPLATEPPASSPLRPAPLRPTSRLRKSGETKAAPETPTAAASDDLLQTMTDAPSTPLKPAPLRPASSRLRKPADSAPESTTGTPSSAMPDDLLKTVTDAPSTASRPLRPAPLRISRPKQTGDADESDAATEAPTSAAPADALKTITDAPSAAPRPLRPAPLRPSRTKPTESDQESKPDDTAESSDVPPSES